VGCYWSCLQCSVKWVHSWPTAGVRQLHCPCLTHEWWARWLWLSRRHWLCWTQRAHSLARFELLPRKLYWRWCRQRARPYLSSCTRGSNRPRAHRAYCAPPRAPKRSPNARRVVVVGSLRWSCCARCQHNPVRRNVTSRASSKPPWPIARLFWRQNGCEWASDMPAFVQSSGTAAPAKPRPNYETASRRTAPCAAPKRS
jgi:hypothetical protein